MATVAITACVYLGDVAPFIPVGRRLVEAGHDVVFVAPEGFRSIVEPEPFRYHPWPLDASPAAMHDDPVHTRLMKNPNLNINRLGRYWMDKSFADDPDLVAGTLSEVFGGVDAVVTHPTTGCVSIPVAHAAGVPVVVGHLFPMMIPTRARTPPLGRRWLGLPGPLSSAAWSVAQSISARSFRDDAVNAMRSKLGLGPLRAAALWGWAEADEVVVLLSPHYFGPAPADWPPVTWGGFSVWDGPAGQEVDPELDRYIDSGDPPVLVTLGTSAATDAASQFATIADGLDQRGLRSVLLVGDEANVGPLRGRPGVAAFAPMTKLLPRCRATVVSGALGGVAASLVAGRPCVVHPQLFDQIWNGGQVDRLGAGRLARRTSGVAAAVERVCNDPSYSERARALADRMRTDDGPGAVVAAVERVLVAA